MGWGGLGGYDQLCCPASPKLLLGLDIGLGCDKNNSIGSCNYSPLQKLTFRKGTPTFDA